MKKQYKVKELNFYTTCNDIFGRLLEFHPDYAVTITIVNGKFKGTLSDNNGIYFEAEFDKSATLDFLIALDDDMILAFDQMVERRR